jgi:hypothetical protein
LPAVSISFLVTPDEIRACLLDRLGDVEALPFSDGEFDGVISTFGVMFAPDQQRAASELAQVCRSGGHLGCNSSNLIRQSLLVSETGPGAGRGSHPRWDRRNPRKNFSLV